MAHVASVQSDRPVSVRELAEQLAVSAKYLEHILKTLKTSGLVHAVRGKQGGYVLGRPAADITLKDVYQCLEGSTAPVDCVDTPSSCESQPECPTWDTWVELKGAIEQVLERTTIQQLAERREQKHGHSETDF
jgi:Rrf2 family protein